jgi:hypothetical protein
MFFAVVEIGSTIPLPSANTATMATSLCLFSVWQVEALPTLPTTEVRCGAKISAIARISDSKNLLMFRFKSKRIAYCLQRFIMVHLYCKHRLHNICRTQQV